jgi:hypothetical protein
MCSRTMIINIVSEPQVQRASDSELHQFKDSCWGQDRRQIETGSN